MSFHIENDFALSHPGLTPVIGGKDGAGLFVEIARGDPQAGNRLRFEANREGAPFSATLHEEHPAYRFQRNPTRFEGSHMYQLSQSLLPLPYGLAALAP